MRGCACTRACTSLLALPLPLPQPSGSLAFLDPKAGGLTKRGTVELTLDGYSAPISAGNFAANVADGLYNNR